MQSFVYLRHTNVSLTTYCTRLRQIPRQDESDQPEAGLRLAENEVILIKQDRRVIMCQSAEADFRDQSTRMLTPVDGLKKCVKL